MKKTYKSSLLALSVLASFTSCSESESLQQANLSKDKITFHATLDNSWKPMSPASSSRAAIAAATEKGPIVVPTPFGKPLYLHPVVQDGIHIWSKEGKPITRSGAPLEDVEHERVAQTRGTMSTKTDLSDYKSFGVTAIYKNGENNVSLFQEENGEPKIAVATSTTEDKVWEIKDSRWPVGSEVSFHAFAPYSAGSTSPLSFKPDVDNEKTQITYTASTTDIVNQPDLILATAKGSQSDNALGLNFSHALTAVTFAIDKDLADVLGAGKKLTSITLSGIPNEGTYDLAVMKGEGTAAPVWQFAKDGGSNKTGKYTFDLKDQDIVTGKDFALTSDNNTLMMIPQTLPETAKLIFQFELDGVLQSLIIDMKDQVWQPGKSVIYKLSAKAINTLSNPEVVYPTTWTAVGYPKQSFNANEAVGLYAVSKDGLVVIPNIKLVKQQDGEGNPIWKTENNQRFIFTTNYKYFAYYPYSNTAPTIDKEATTAAEFFKDMIDKWTPVSAQQDDNTLVSQDLQVASGVVKPDASTLEFKMAHQVSLAVLTLSDKKIPVTCYFKDNSYKYYYGDKTIEPKISKTEGEMTLTASTDFKDNVPYCVTKGTKYLQIIPLGVKTSFKAGNPNDETRTHWGFLKSHSLTPTESTPQQLSIQADPAFIYGVRDFEYDTRYNPVTGAGVGQELEFVQEFGVPEEATYKLECWGASSAKQTAWYGYEHQYPDNGGGYSKGNAKLKVTQTLYVCVGGEGTPNVPYGQGQGYNWGGYGGYNGGRNPRNGAINSKLGGSGGGGATHIGFKKALLTAFKQDYDTQLLMVAGGRGGDCYNWTGGYGGGDTAGGSQSQSQGFNVISNYDGSGNFYDPHKNNAPYWYIFGLGEIARESKGSEYGSGGGGGGFWGGWAGTNSYSSGGGGTGYVNKAFLDSEAKTIAGNVLFDSPNGVQEKGHKGHGAAKISWEAKKCFNP